MNQDLVMNLMTRRRALAISGKAVVGVGAGLAVVSLTGCPTAAQWEAIAIANIPTILQVVAGIVAIASNPAVPSSLEAEIVKVAAEVTKDLNTAKNLIAGYKSAPSASVLSQIDAALIDAQSNLGDLLSAFHVSDPVLMATIAASIGLAITTVIAIQATVPAPAGAPAVRLNLAKNNGASAIKQAFNFIVIKNYPSNVIA